MIKSRVLKKSRVIEWYDNNDSNVRDYAPRCLLLTAWPFFLLSKS
jgi:hypothetical protein